MYNKMYMHIFISIIIFISFIVLLGEEEINNFIIIINYISKNILLKKQIIGK